MLDLRRAKIYTKIMNGELWEFYDSVGLRRIRIARLHARSRAAYCEVIYDFNYEIDYQNFTFDELAGMEPIEHECSGDCDHCIYRAEVPGTGERIDREPAYYCRRYQDEKEI